MAINDQKNFYRKLDALLSKIQSDAGVKKGQVLSTVLHELVEGFREDLSIVNGRIYSVEPDRITLCGDARSWAEEPPEMHISREYPPVRLLFENRCYIFDANTPGIDAEFEKGIVGGTTSAAIVVGREHQYVLAFGLADGWDQAELEFSLNTIRNALTHRLEHEWIAADMEETRLIQRSLFPRSFPDFPGYEFAARVAMAEVVGGDFFDFIPIDEEALGIATGDVSGHGLPAALLVRDVVTGLRMGVEKDMKITPIIRKLNGVIHRSTFSTKFVSLFYGELEQNGNLMFVNAGHIPPFLLLDRGTFRLEVGGSILGPLPEARFKRGFAHLDKGGVFVAVSDGIMERADARDDQFGEKRIGEVIESCRNESAPEILETLFDAARSFGVGRWEDDATVVVVRRLP